MDFYKSNESILSNLTRLAVSIGKLILTGWLIIGATLLLIIGLEQICSLNCRIFCEKKDKNFLKNVECYKNEPWVKEYFKEFRAASQTHWVPYVYFRWNPFKGKYLNIDKQGLRLTEQSELNDNAATKKLKIFMFGGSTLWGWGVRDQYTIPSLLVEDLSKNHIKAEITNYSQPGYVSTQEMIDLMMQLQRGNVPDLVIFYDGVNDIFSAYQSGVAGIPQNETNREKEYNLINIYKKLRTEFLLKFMDRFCLGRTLKALSQKNAIKQHQNLMGLENNIVEIYLNNIKIIDGISKAYGFKTMFYWQPIIYYKNFLTKVEATHNQDEIMRKFNMKTYDIINHMKSSLESYHFYNISDIFSDIKDPLYIDYCHVNEDGNQIIAKRMANDVTKEIRH